MTSSAVSVCALCGEPATTAMEPPRRSLVRGLDPSDPSRCVTAILPDVPLCNTHAVAVHSGERTVGWCDDSCCRIYGEAGACSPCGAEYEQLSPAGRGRASVRNHPSSN